MPKRIVEGPQYNIRERKRIYSQKIKNDTVNINQPSIDNKNFHRRKK